MIKHLRFVVHDTHTVERVVYLCNWAVEPTPEKLTSKDSEVTCKNCLRIMSNQMIKGGD